MAAGQVRLFHALHDTAVTIDVRPEVRAAAQQVRESLRQAAQQSQWNTSTWWPRSKHGQPATDISLAPSCSTQKASSGQLTQGAHDTSSAEWNASTSLDRGELKQQAAESDQKSLKHSRRRREELIKGDSYVTPLARSTLVTEQMRQTKLAQQCQSDKEAQESTAPGGAKARRRGGRATKDDLAAVAALPDLPPAIPIAPEQNAPETPQEAPAAAVTENSAPMDA